jgi:hypothetical protein
MTLWLDIFAGLSFTVHCLLFRSTVDDWSCQTMSGENRGKLGGTELSYQWEKEAARNLIVQIIES